MARAERWAAAVAGIIGLGFVVATGREGGEMVYDHAAGIPTSVLQAEMMNREAGHSHDGEEAGTPPHEDAPAKLDSAAASNVPADTGVAKKDSEHVHAPGTPEHED
jgi:hypothetical protein